MVRPKDFTGFVQIVAEEVPVAKLRLHPVIQRFRHNDHPQQREARVEYLASHWDDAKCSRLVVVAAPDGMREVCRGGHRMEAARRLGLPALRCDVYYGLDMNDWKQASWLVERVLAQEDQRGFTVYNTYELNVLSGLEPDVSIERILNENSARTSPSSGAPRAYACIDKLRQLHSTGHLFSTIFIIETAWRRFDHESALESRAARSAPMVQALGKFVEVYAKHPNFSDNTLAERLATRSPQALVLDSRVSSRALRLTPVRSLCQSLLAIYNKGKRGRELPPFKMPRKKG